jgi:hypothetical protein
MSVVKSAAAQDSICGRSPGGKQERGRFGAECLSVTDFCFLWDFSVHTRKAVPRNRAMAEAIVTGESTLPS